MKLTIEYILKFKWYFCGVLLVLFSLVLLMNSIERYVISSIQESTGRITKITGLDISWSSSPRFKAEMLSLGGFSSEDSSGNFVTARGIEGQIEISSLFAERLEVIGLNISELVLDTHFSLLNVDGESAEPVPFLSTPLPLMGAVAVEQFSLLTRSNGVLNAPLSQHRLSLQPTFGSTGGSHRFDSSGYLEGVNELVITALLDVDQFSISFDQLRFVLNGQVSLVDGEIVLSSVVPQVSLSLKSDSWSWGSKVEENQGSIDTASRTPSSARLFSDDLLPLWLLREVDMSVEAHVNKFISGDIKFFHSRIDSTLDKGVLNAKLSSTGEHGGTLFAEGEMDYSSGRRANVNMNGWLREYPSHRIKSFSKLGLLKDGELDAQFEIQATGRSLAEMAANSEGYLRSIVGKGQLRDRWIDNLGGDMAKALKHWIKDGEKSSNRLNCLAMNLEFEQGFVKIDKNILFSTPAATIVGIGKLDLASEKIALRVEPMARTGTGLNASTYINVVQIGGTLSAPKPTLNGVGAFKAGTSVFLATATGGISLLAEGFLKRKLRKDYSCNDVLSREIFPAMD